MSPYLSHGAALTQNSKPRTFSCRHVLQPLRKEDDARYQVESFSANRVPCAAAHRTMSLILFQGTCGHEIPSHQAWRVPDVRCGIRNDQCLPSDASLVD